MKGLIVSIAVAALLLTTAIAGYSLNSSDGVTIYTADCASCHGANGDTTIDPNVKTANVAQISKAFNTHTTMKTSILSTNVGVIGAGLKGQLTLKQKNAIVANFKIYRGEDLYTQKFTDPAQITWNCSNVLCHGSYDNSNIPESYRTYGKIVNSFNKKKSTMKAYKSKYKLSELQLIANALAVAPVFTNPTGGTTSVNGAARYYMDCMPCHNGPISDPIGYDSAIAEVAGAGSAAAGANLITNAINTNAGAGTTLGGMGTQALMNLTPAEIQSIATAIQTKQLPSPTSIYSSLTCAGSAQNPSCHNSDGSTPWNGN